MVKKRKLAIPYTSIFICMLPQKTQEIIRSDIEEYARENGYLLLWDKEINDYVGMSGRFSHISEIYNDTILVFCKEGEDAMV